LWVLQLGLYISVHLAIPHIAIPQVQLLQLSLQVSVGSVNALIGQHILA